jgi:hypothetical protein
MKLNIAQAIISLKPNSEFTLTNQDYSKIEWDVLEGEAPTLKQVNDELKRLEQLKIDAKSELLDRLGITAEEAQLLLS